MQNSTGIKSKALALAAARQDLAAARAAFYPSVTAGLTYTHLFEQPSQELFGTTTYLAAADPIGLSANLGQTLYTFGKIKGGVKLAEGAVAQAALDLREETRKTVMLIKKAFYGYLLALEVQGINRDTLERKQEALEVAGLRYKAGLVADYEVLRAESDLENYRATVISSENAVRVALLNVRNVLGIQEEDFEFELVGALEPLPIELDAKAMLARAQERKYELASFRQNLDLLAAQAALNRSLALPTLAGFVGYSLKSGFDAATGKNEYFTADAWDGTWTAGLSFNVPVSALFPWSRENGRDPQVGPAAGEPEAAVLQPGERRAHRRGERDPENRGAGGQDRLGPQERGARRAAVRVGRRAVPGRLHFQHGSQGRPARPERRPARLCAGRVRLQPERAGPAGYRR